MRSSYIMHQKINTQFFEFLIVLSQFLQFMLQCILLSDSFPGKFHNPFERDIKGKQLTVSGQRNYIQRIV